MASAKQKPFDRQTARFLSRIAENMPADLTSGQMQAYIEAPEKLGTALQVLSRLLIGKDHEPIIPWREFVIGGKSVEELIVELGPYCIDDEHWPSVLRNKSFVVLPSPHLVTTAIVTPKMLGFVKDVRLLPLLARAKACGLSWHPSLAAHVRLEYEEPDNQTTLYFPMEPIEDDEGRPSIFATDKDDGYDTAKGGRFFWAMPGDGDHSRQEAYKDVRENDFHVEHEFVFIIGEPKPI